MAALSPISRYWLLLILLALPFAVLAQTPGVGIGTTAPNASAALDIVSSSKGVLLPRVTDATAIASPATGLIVFQTGGTPGFYYNAGSPTSPNWQRLSDAATASGQFIQNQTAADQTGGFRLSGNGALGGNLGIGTTSPLARLSISPVTTEPKLTFFDGGSAASHYGLGVSGGQLNYHVLTASDQHVFYATGKNGDGTELMRVQGNGRVGIGTSSPANRLDVNGDLRVGYPTTIATSLGTSGTGNSAISANGPIGQSFTLATASVLSSLTLNSSSPSTTTLTFYQGNGNGGLAMTAPQSIVFAGTGSQTFTLASPLALAAGTYTLMLDRSTYVRYFTSNSYGGGSLYNGTVALSSSDLDFTLNYTAAATATALYAGPGGSVGVGTNAPAATLEVAGSSSTVRLGGLAGTGTRVVTVGASGDLSTIATASLGDNLGSHVATQNLSLGSNKLVGSGTSGLSIASTGAVATDGALSISPSTTEAKLTLYDGGSSGNHYGLGVSSGQFNYHVSAAAANHVFYAGGKNGSGLGATELLRIQGDGNVGIGTTGPLTRLSLSPSTAEAKITLYDGGSTTAHYGLGVSSGQFNYHVSAAAANHVFYAGGKNGDGTELLRIQGNGRVGIGTTSTSGAPTALLDVNGSTRLRGLTTAGVVTTDAQGNLSSSAGSGSFVQNQTTQQTGNFNVSGTGTVGGLLSAGSAQVRNLTTAGVVTTDAQGNLGTATAATLDATTASNGLTKTGTNVALGGALTQNTTVLLGGNSLNLATATGQVSQLSSGLTFSSSGSGIGVGQSFTLPAGATITQVDVYNLNDPFNGTFVLYQGGAGGTALTAPQAVSYAGSPTVSSIVLTTPVTAVTAGTYSFSLGGSGTTLFAATSYNSYAGGNAYENTIQTGYDLKFVVYYNTLTALSASGSGVGIGLATPSATLDVNGNARVRGLTAAGIVTTDANGNLTSSPSVGGADATTASNGLTKTGQDVALGGALTQATAINQGPNAFSLPGTGSVGIGTGSPSAAAALDVSSTAKGALLPRLSQVQREALTTAHSLGAAHTGLLVYNTTTKALNAWDGTKWTEVLSSGAGTATAPTATTTFAYTGTAQTYTVPAGVYQLTVTATGGAGGTWAGATAGAGAQVQATLTVVPGEVLTVNVGGQGGVATGSGRTAGGWNGGGSGGPYGAGGGGATDLSRAAAQGSTGDYLGSRNALLVAAGGGGSDVSYTSGGGGGQPSPGGDGAGSGSPGIGATQTGPGGGGAAGANNVGGNGVAAAGGGGGYYGGGGGSYYGSSFGNAGGGGGSSWVMPAGSSAVSYGTAPIGNGALTITAGGLAAPVLNGVNITGVPGTWDTNGSTYYHLGNVGIGTSTPSQKLEVNGNARVTGNMAVAGAASVTGNASVAGNANVSGNTYAGGNVGIGTTGPATRLSISPTTTEAKITLFDSGDATDHFGFGVSGGQLNYHVRSTSDRHVFYAKGRNGGGGSAIELLRIQGDGNVGIGTDSPGQKLSVTGGLQVAANGSFRGSAALDQGAHLQWNRSGGAGETWLINHLGGGNSSAGIRFGGITTATGTTPTEWARFLNNGNFGIGTTNPVAPLHVSGAAPATPTGAQTYFGISSTGLTSGSSVAARGVVAYFTGGQLWVNDFIVAGALQTTSDRRIKRVVGLSDRAADLALLNKVRITDYTYIDQHANTDKVVKKVIAQEVAELLPAAVSQSRQAIPNVYERASRVSYADGYVTLRTTKPHELPAGGGTLRLYTPTNQELSVAVSVVDAHTVRFASPEAHADGLFVYGKYVDDFLSVDYDALTTLNVSATQELARQVAELQRQNATLLRDNATLKAGAAADHADLQTVKEQLARLLGEGAAGGVQAYK